MNRKQLRLWDDPPVVAPEPAPAKPARARRPTIPRHIRRHAYDISARPATRPHGYYLTRKIRILPTTGSYL